MRVGVIGSGDVGRVLAAGLLKHGYEVMLGTRDPGAGKIAAWQKENPGISSGTFEEAARFGEMIVLAVAGAAVENAVDLAGPVNFEGKVVIDTNNPIASRPPVKGVLQFTTGPNESLGEWLQQKLPGARIVKAFSCVGSELMVNPSFEQGMPTMFICGNDESAKAEVIRILDLFGWEPYDCGAIEAARAIEPLCLLWCLPFFLRQDRRHAFRMLSR